jgi:CheY-like chemotaxis protein
MHAMFTVFIVDDDASVIKALSRLMRLKGYDAQSYTSPQEFLAHHDAALPGCAVLDVSMPGLNGLELQHALTAGGCVRPVIFITGKGDIPTSVRAMKAGAIYQAGEQSGFVGGDSAGRRARFQIPAISRRPGIDRGEDCDLDPARAPSAHSRCRRSAE